MYATVLATIIVYWAGLSGPFLLDDLPNLNPLQQWLDGQTSAAEVIFGNRSGVLGRPVSMLTLWLSAATGGLHPFPFKLGNLVIHILCGLLGWQVLRRVLAEDPRLFQHAPAIAAVMAGLWMLHPINVSTVLYPVQRMAQLSTLFCLASVWTYVVARTRLIGGNTRVAVILLFGIFPLLTVAGILSKENAAVGPALCLAIELAYFRKQPSRQPILPIFFGVFLLLPLAATATLLTAIPDVFFGGYAIRDFSLAERLLTQPRALMEYLGLLLFPRGELMGVFVDDFSFSTSLADPPSTSWSILALIAISFFAVKVRNQAPAILTGWLFFLIAHAVESTILPLELYFEHRNYLPAFGILLAVTGLLVWLADRLLMTKLVSVIGWILAAITMVGLGGITSKQTKVWQSMDDIVAQALEHRPQSIRARLQQLTLATQAERWPVALATIDSLKSSSDPQARFLGLVHGVTIDCLRGAGGNPLDLARAQQAGLIKISFAEVQAYSPLSLAVGHGHCGPAITEKLVGDAIVDLLESMPSLPEHVQPKWLMRLAAADLYIRSGNWNLAKQQAEIAWQPGISDTAIAGLLVRIYVHLGNKSAAQHTLDQARAHTSPREQGALRAMEYHQHLISEMPDAASHKK